MVGCDDHLLLHEQAWVDQDSVLTELQRRCGPLQIRIVADAEVSLAEAVASYLFNGQLLATPSGWTLVVPAECAEGPASTLIARLIDEGFIARSLFIDVRESMRGGGGPACLRLRLPLTLDELGRVHQGIRLDHAQITQLEKWVDAHYRESLTPADLADPRLIAEAHAANDALMHLLSQPSQVTL